MLVLVVVLATTPFAAAAPDAPAAPLAAILLTGGAYTQDFDTLASSGTSSTTPAGWAFSESGANANTTYTAGTGSSNTGDTYSFGATNASDRAFGGLLSGNLTPTIGAEFQNSTGAAIVSLAISYNCEQWRLGATGRFDRMDFQYSLNATSLTTGTWVDVNALDCPGTLSTGTVGAIDGNINRTAVSATITGLNLANGAGFWLRWNDFNASGADDGLAVDDFTLTPTTSVVDTPPTVASTNPANNATNVPVGSDIAITFSEPVTVSGNWFQIVCTVSGTRNVADTAVSGGPASYTIDPNADFVTGETCTVTVFASQVADQDGTPDNMAADYVFSFSTPAADPCSLPFTPIYDIQGSGMSAAITGAVTTQGVVVGDFELPGGSGQLRGFYLQDLTGDADPATSDGIFVFTGGSDTVSLGQVVRVAGTAEDFQDQTQISNATVTQCGVSGNVTPVDISLPFADANYPERYEGMLVRFLQPLYVTEHFQLGRFGQIVLTSRPDRLQQPTNVTTPGAAALALQAANNLDRIIVDDDNNTQNPDPILFGRGGNPLSASNTLRGGDSAAGIVGVLTYTWSGNAASGNAYRLRPVGALNGGVINFTAANSRPAPPAVSGRLRVTAANVLNYFNSWSGCTLGVGGAATNCRGANNQTEFDRQWPKIVAGLVESGADVIGLMEIENDGYGASSAIQDLVNKLNAATAAGTYAFINPDVTLGVNALGVDAIKVGLLYKPGKVTPAGTTAALNTNAFVNGGDSGPRNRPALAQAFEEVGSGERFIVVVNHLKSKGSACDAPDAGDGQGNCNGVRTYAANLMTAWLATDPTGTGDPDILIMGDLNSYAQEDPITAIKGAGYVNRLEDRLGLDAYTYVFDGQWGYLDHALATNSLSAQVAGVETWHINADEPSVLDYNTEFKTPGQIASLYANDRFRSSDHDPVIVGLNLDGTLAVTLAGFSAVQQGDHVLVTWETVSELDNRGFNLHRGTSPAGPDRQLNDALIPSQSPGSPSGFAYAWEDAADLVPGTSYFYWLEAVDVNGATDVHGPVSAEFGAPTAVTLGAFGAAPVAAELPALAGLAALALAALAGARRRAR